MSTKEQRLPFAVYNSEGEFIAATKYAEEAAHLVSFEGIGAVVKNRPGRILWTEGIDGEAGESYDHAAEVMQERA